MMSTQKDPQGANYVLCMNCIQQCMIVGIIVISPQLSSKLMTRYQKIEKQFRKCIWQIYTDFETTSEYKKAASYAAFATFAEECTDAQRARLRRLVVREKMKIIKILKINSGRGAS